MSETQAVLGVAVVGLGVGEQHLRSYLCQRSCRLRWLYDLDAARSEEVAREFGIRSAAVDYEQILDDPETSVVSIASYDDAHADQVVAALEAGKHVFVEKPLCRTPEELNRIRSAWESNSGCHLRSNLVLRTAPLYRWLRGAIKEDQFGDLYALDGDYLYGRLHKITGGWRKKIVGYSVMQGGGVHLVDLMLWLTDQQPTTVFSAGNRIATSDTEFQSHDYVAATYGFESGLVGRISANFGCVHRHHHVLRIFGTRASFVYDDQGPRLHETSDPTVSIKRIEVNPLPADKGALIPDFIQAILDSENAAPAARREFDVIRTCFAADASLATGKKVHIKDGS